MPNRASAANMLLWVDAELAFLSTLELASGAVKAVPSVSPFETVPKPTASITVPVSAAPSLRATLLLLVSVCAVLLSQAKEALRLVLHQRKNP